MTLLYTEETPKSLSKSQIIYLFLQIQEHTSKTIFSQAEETKDLNSNFKRVKSNVVVAKKAIDALVKHVTFLESQCWKIMDIPLTIDHSYLEETPCKVLQHIG